MAETPWGPDVLPHGLEEFDTPQAEGTWTLQDTVVADQAFATAAAPSTDVYWGGPVSLQFDAEAGGVDGTATPSGVSAMFAIGATTATGDASSLAAGVVVSSAVGSAVASGDALTALSGVSAAASISTATAMGDALTQLAGVVMIASMGTAEASGGSVVDATASSAGVSASAAVGSASLTGEAVAEPMGVEMLAAVGQASAFDADAIVVPFGGVSPRRQIELIERISVTVFPNGVKAEFTIGQDTAYGDAHVVASGVAITAAMGTPAVSVDVVAELVGVALASAIGQATVFDLHVQPVRWYAGIDAVAAPRGVAARAEVGLTRADGTDAIDRAWHDLQLDEDDELVLLGVIA